VADQFRNVAIIAHVDHGKTSMVDQLLRQSGSIIDDGERVMDNNQLEKERGITILAKNTSIQWKGKQINIVDTPGHGDFGGEVERVLGMVDGVCLLVDANEGPMTQTKFVLRKALAAGLRPLVVLNKMDRPNARAEETETSLFDLFTQLDATDEQLDYPTLYASAKEGWAVRSMDDDKELGVAPLLDAIIERVPAPTVTPGPFSMLITNLESDQFMGRIVTGRVVSGSVKVGDELHCLSSEGEVLETCTVYKVVARKGLERVVIEKGVAGDIIGVSGFTKATATMTICDKSIKTAIPTRPIDPPVLSMVFQTNKGPLAGKEGTQLVGRKILPRIEKELESNVSMAMEKTSSEDSIVVKGRGELQLGVLLENMRREGFEICVSQPRIMMKKDKEGNVLEPIEEVMIEVDQEHSSWVMEALTQRLGKMDTYIQEDDKVKILFHVPARGLLGFRSEFMNATSGSGIITHTFHSFQPYKGALMGREKGALISMADGVTTAYALDSLQARGTLYVGPGAKVYQGMIIGVCNKEDDLDVNPSKEKHLSNVRTVMKEEQTKLQTPRVLTLEDALAIVKDDELVEITPKSIRLRKIELDKNERQRTRSKKGGAKQDEFTFVQE
jgi:GTP-binding protein